MDEWQFSFVVRGLHVPKEDVVCDDDLLIKRHGEADNEADVFMKITEAEAKNSRIFYRPFERKFDQTLQLYGLETGMYARRSPGWASRRITEDTPFGQPPARSTRIKILSPTYPPDAVENLYTAFRFAVRKQKMTRQIFADNSKAFIRHGLEYYYTALGEDTIEKKTIDLFVALESLFSKDQELRFRISLRASSLLGSIGEDRTEVFETVYNLYNQRSKIVHGVAKTEVSSEQISKLERYMRDCLKIFFHLEKGKDEILSMLDASLYNENAKSEIQRLTTEAYQKWKN